MDSKIKSSTDKYVFRFRQSSVQRVLPAYDYCRTLFVVWTVHNDLITARSVAVESWEEPASIWLTVAKNVFVGWAFNFRVRVLLKSAVNFTPWKCYWQDGKIRPGLHYVGEIWKQSPVPQPFWICVCWKLALGSDVIILTSSFSKSFIFEIFSFTRKRKTGVFKFLRLGDASWRKRLTKFEPPNFF